MTEYDWDFEPMSDDELDAEREKLEGSELESIQRRLIKIYKELRAQVAEDQIPDAFKPVIDELVDDSETP